MTVRSMNVNLNNIILVSSFILISLDINAEDLSINPNFQSGDIISAESFNQIFNTIERINRTVIDDDLLGVWSCDAMTTRETPGWEDNGLFYVLKNAQVNFTASEESLSSFESPYIISTSSPSPFKRTEAAFNAEYSLYKNMLFTKMDGQYDTSARIFSVNVITPEKIEFVFQETSAQSFPTSYSSFISCESMEAVPAQPSLPEISQNGAINLSWVDNSDDEVGFNIYRKSNTESSYSLLTTTTEISYQDADVEEGSRYTYKISAYNDNGESTFTNQVEISSDTLPPTVISISPSPDTELAIDDRSFTVTFSEQVVTICPDENDVEIYPGGYCSTTGGAITGTAAIERNDARDFVIGGYYSNNVGSLTISGSAMGSAELFQPNQTFDIKINKDWIKDINGVSMSEDQIFTFTVGSTQNNPQCPPNC